MKEDNNKIVVNLKNSNDNIVYPPGAFIRELLDKNYMTIKELAAALEIPEQRLRNLLDGDTVLTERIAHKLEEVFDVSYKTFLNREILWRKYLMRKRRGYES